MDCGKVGFPPIPSKGCFSLASPEPLEPFSFPSLVHLIPCTSTPHRDLPGSWEEGQVRSTGRGRGGRNGSFWQEGASWDLPPFRAHPQGHIEESSLLPSTFLSLFPPHSFAWDDTVLGCPCFRVGDSRLVEPTCSG